jgi:hypothetical protein
MPCRLCMKGWHMLNFDPYYILSYFSTVFENKYSTVCCGITRTSGLKTPTTEAVVKRCRRPIQGVKALRHLSLLEGQNREVL